MPALSFDIIARDRASKVFDQVGASADKTNKGFDKVGTGMGSTIARIGKGVVGLTAGFQIMDKVVVGGFQRFTALENAEKRMDSMGLSTSQTADLMDQLTDTVTGTAFSLDAGASTMANFIAAGVDLDDVNDRLQMTADTAAFAQQPLDEIGNIFGKIQTQGKLTAEELNMLQERGVPALVLLADAAGVTAEAMRSMISDGEITAERFFQLWEQGSKGFGENSIKIEGAAKDMGDTLSGSLANAGTAAARLGEVIADDVAPFVKDLSDGFVSLVNLIKDLDAGTRGWNSSLADLISKAREEDINWWEKSVPNLIGGLTEADEKTRMFSSAMDGAKSSGEGLADATGEVAEEFDAAAVAAEEAAAAIDGYQNALKAATDPVFALHSAVSKLEKAQQGSKDAARDLKRVQEDLNELRADSDASTRDLEDAERKVADAQREVTDSGWAVAEALAGIEAAAVNGDLSFSEFSSKLDEWVASSEITAKQADNIRDRVAELTGTAKDYSGEYVADLLAETNEGKLDKAQRELDAVARPRSPAYLAELDRQAEIKARNRLDTLANRRQPVFAAQMDESARARTKSRLDAVAIQRRPEFRAEASNTGRVDALLNQLARPRHAVITVGYAVTGSGLPRGLQHGGPVEASRPYIVGEAGPEWFVPDRPGLVVSNKDAKSLMRSNGGGAPGFGGGGLNERELARRFVMEMQRAGIVVPRTEIARRADLYARSG